MIDLDSLPAEAAKVTAARDALVQQLYEGLSCLRRQVDRHERQIEHLKRELRKCQRGFDKGPRKAV